MVCLVLWSRSREGAWIEINEEKFKLLRASVAPARERGLKFFGHDFRSDRRCRSREGAWIEIRQWAIRCMHEASRSREGAWIEILWTVRYLAVLLVAPARERGLKYQFL